MNNSRSDLFSEFENLGISTETFEHEPVFTVEEAQALRGKIEGGHCKNLFLKDKNSDFWLIVCLEDKRIDLKLLPEKIGAGKLSFARPELLMELLGVEPGSVTPFAVLNDVGGRVRVILDSDMMALEKLNFHPLKNTATTSIRSADLLLFLSAMDHSPKIVAL